jgi:hypothetical protein
MHPRGVPVWENAAVKEGLIPMRLIHLVRNQHCGRTKEFIWNLFVAQSTYLR